jgi:hypothetical protein
MTVALIGTQTALHPYMHCGPTWLGTPVSKKLQIPLYHWVHANGPNSIATWVKGALRPPPEVGNAQ